MSLFRRALWHVNRTPAARGIKAGLRLAHRGEIARRRREGALLPSDQAAMDLAERLRADGYAMADETIPRDARSKLAEAAGTLGLDADRDASVFASRKTFWTSLVENAMVDGQLPASDPLVRFALHPSVLAPLAKRYGELPRLDYVAITHSTYAGPELKVSQLWHRDFDDTTVTKLFVYLTDVTTCDGPFTFIPGPVSDRIGFRRRSHRSDAEVGLELDLAQARAIEGPALTGFFVETSRCLHMGSRVAPDGERLMYTATFISSPRIYPERPRNFFRLDGSESALERSVLTAG